MASKHEAVPSEGNGEDMQFTSGSSDRGTFDDREQLVKLGKKPVLKVTTVIMIYRRQLARATNR